MQVNDPEPQKDFWQVSVGLAMLAIVLVAYALPEVVAAISKSPFMYVNAWDEETYLTLQGAEAAKNRPGYQVLYIVKWLIESGVSGVWINFYSDLVIVPAICWLVYAALRNFGYPAASAIFGALIIPFSSVLVNRANPYIYSNIDINTESWIVTGYETYASILRTPNPQFSYLLIAAAVFAFARFRNPLVLALPVPFLYPFVLLPYAYLAAIITIFWLVGRWRPEYSVITTLFVAHLMTIASLFLAYFIFIQLYPTTNVGAYQTARGLLIARDIFAVPIASMVIFAAVLISMTRSKILALQIASLLACSLAIANMHLVTGISLQQKNLHDYGSAILLGIALFLLVDHMIQNSNSGIFGKILAGSVPLILSLTIAALVAQSSGVSFEDYKYKIWVGTRLKNPADRMFIQKYPLNALIPNTNFSSKFAYSTPGAISPLLSYQYLFGARRTCSQYQQRYREAMTNTGLLSSLNELDQRRLKIFTRQMDQQLKFRLEDRNVIDYCNALPLASSGDRIISTTDKQFVYFPR